MLGLSNVSHSVCLPDTAEIKAIWVTGRMSYFELWGDAFGADQYEQAYHVLKGQQVHLVCIKLTRLNIQHQEVN